MEKMKNTIRKYAGIALLAGTLASQLYAQAENLPIEPQTRTAIVEAQIKEKKARGLFNESAYSNALINAKLAFNTGIRDRNFSVDEQTQVQKYLNEAKKYHEVLPEEYKKLDELIESNLRLVGSGLKRFEKELTTEGLEVKVERDWTPWINITLPLIPLGISLYFLTKGLLKRRKE